MRLPSIPDPPRASAVHTHHTCIVTPIFIASQKVTRGVMYTREEAEGKRLRNPFDTITEGIGINRLTANFNRAQIDGAFKGVTQPPFTGKAP